jgi:hypothetical protein
MYNPSTGSESYLIAKLPAPLATSAATPQYPFFPYYTMYRECGLVFKSNTVVYGIECGIEINGNLDTSK